LKYKVSGDSKIVSDSGAYILPGVGDFSNAMDRIKKLNLMPILLNLKYNTKPFLGICLGMQILASTSSENKISKGLGLIDLNVEKISIDHLRIPHVGWNKVVVEKGNPLFQGIPKDSYFYFNHSYTMVGANKNNVIAKVLYGTRLVAAVQKDNIFGVQFHPEKSQESGLILLQNYFNYVEYI